MAGPSMLTSGMPEYLECDIGHHVQLLLFEFPKLVGPPPAGWLWLHRRVISTTTAPCFDSLFTDTTDCGGAKANVSIDR